MDAYEEGYKAGYYDENEDNPYHPLTKEYADWEEGNEQGRMDC